MTTERKILRSLTPGDKLVCIESKKLVGPRGGKYVVRGVKPSKGTATFTGSSLSGDGKIRTFHFEEMASFEVESKLSCLLVCQIEGS